LPLRLAPQPSWGGGIDPVGPDEQDEARDQEPEERHGAREPYDAPGQEAAELYGEKPPHAPASDPNPCVSSRNTVSRLTSSGRSSERNRPREARISVTRAPSLAGIGTRKAPSSMVASRPALVR